MSPLAELLTQRTRQLNKALTRIQDVSALWQYHKVLATSPTHITITFNIGTYQSIARLIGRGK